ncbi:hypothetical protein WDU94_002304 [Cyamophila willieti]
MTEDYFWGLTLDSKKTHDCWDPDIEKGDKSADSSQGFRGEHTLLVKQAVIGANAKEGEVHVVEVEAMGFRADIKLPIVVLKAGVNNHAPLDLLFPDPPVTFKLVKGSGPIYLFGNHSVGTGEPMGEDDDEESIDEDFSEEEADESEIMSNKNMTDDKKRKLNNSNNKKGGTPTKKAKTDDDAE